MSVLSMVALRMVTQEGPRKCLKIYEELKKNVVGKAATPLAGTSTTTTAANTRGAEPPVSSKSAKRRIRRRKLKESRRGEEITGTEETGTKEPRESDDENVARYNLVTHADRRTSKDFLERSLMAAFLLKCLQRVGFFARPTPDDGTYHLIPATSPVSRGLYLTFGIICRIASSRGLSRGEKNVLARARRVNLRFSRFSAGRGVRPLAP